ncbi:MAG: tyrosine protein kinase, partial [Chlorobi bacterium]|nr:tyrosine protein kinase [Chlorobiota bacterium]
MTDNTIHNPVLKPTGNSSSGFMFDLDLKKLVFDLLKFWWLFIISISISLLVVWSIHRYTIPVYKASMKLLLEVRGGQNSKGDMMQGFGLTPGLSNIENQIAILSSRKMFEKTIKRLDYNLSYYIQGRVKVTEVYQGFPFVIYFDSTHVQLLNTPIHINVINDKKFRLSFSTKEETPTFIYKKGIYGRPASPAEFSKTYNFGEIITTQWFSLAIYCKNCTANKSNDYFIKFHSPSSLVESYRSRFNIYKADENSSIVQLSLTGTNNFKNIKFLNKLAEVFIESNLEE